MKYIARSASSNIACALRIPAANEKVNPIFTITDIIWHIWQYRGGVRAGESPPHARSTSSNIVRALQTNERVVSGKIEIHVRRVHREHRRFIHKGDTSTRSLGIE